MSTFVPAAASSVVVRLDETRKFSTVHGDRTPQDPHYSVAYWQDDLPFDATGTLIPDPGVTQPFSGHDSEGKPVQFQPLYNDKRRAILAKRLDRLARQQPTELDDENAHPLETIEQLAEEVNFKQWLLGEAQYEPTVLYKAFEKRFGRKHHVLKELVVELVLDEKLVRPEAVVPYLRRLLPTDAADPTVSRSFAA